MSDLTTQLSQEYLQDRVLAATTAALPAPIVGSKPTDEKPDFKKLRSLFIDIMGRTDEEFMYSTLYEITDRWNDYATFKDSRAYKYAVWASTDSSGKVGRYVRKQCAEWLKAVDDGYVDVQEWNKITALLKAIQHPDLGRDMYSSLENYSLLFIYAVLCTKIDGKMYYSTGLLEIARKNYKTFTAAVIFIIGMLTLPRFSRHYVK